MYITLKYIIALMYLLCLFKIRLWDCRQPNPAAEASLTERVYAMDCLSPALVAGTADKNFHVFDITGTEIIRSMVRKYTFSENVFLSSSYFYERVTCH